MHTNSSHPPVTKIMTIWSVDATLKKGELAVLMQIPDGELNGPMEMYGFNNFRQCRNLLARYTERGIKVTDFDH